MCIHHTHPQEPGANGYVFVDKRVIVLPASVQVLHQWLCQHIKGSLVVHHRRESRGDAVHYDVDVTGVKLN